MKKFLFSILIIYLFCNVQQVFASYPIPSNSVEVKYRANFQELQPSRGKRDVKVRVICTGLNLMDNCSATVWVYSLDMTTILGPYTVNGGETLSVPIDEREWGVLVQTDDIITVDVWTCASGLGSEGTNNQFEP
jgi:hypothetical protein